MCLHFFRNSYITKQRYDTVYDITERELKIIVETPENKIFLDTAKEALKRADEARRYSFDSWNYIHEVQIYTVLAMSPASRRARTTSLLTEIAEKVPAWRQKQAKALIGTPEKPKEDASPQDVAEAMRIRNDYFNTQFTRIAYRRSNLNFLGALLITILGVMLVTTCCSNIYDPRSLFAQMFWVLEFGSLGACLSMAYTLTSAPVTAKIPEHLMSGFIVFARMGIGATCAIVSLMLLRSGMLSNIISSKLYDDKENNVGYIVIAFIAGFSERWIMRVIDKVSSDSKSKDK